MIETLLEALDKSNEVIMTGAAGTGKTTLIKALHKKWRGEIIQMAPTGRATARLKVVTDRPATTIHSKVFNLPEEDDDGAPVFKKVKKFGGRSSLVVIDESSMVGRFLYDAIKKAALPGTRFLFVGDENQVLPVGDICPLDWTKAQVKLTQIHRTDGDIIPFSQAILACDNAAALKKLIRNPGYKDVEIKPIALLPPSLWKSTNLGRMLIVVTNKLRFQVNAAVRQRLGYATPLEKGEHLLVRTNHLGTGLMNGETVEVNDILPNDADVALNQPHYSRVQLIGPDNQIHTTNVVPSEFEVDNTDWRLSRRNDSQQWKSLLAEDKLTLPHWIAEKEFVGDRLILGQQLSLYILITDMR